jgi:dCMP deaminase
MKDRHAFYLNIATSVAEASYCNRNKVGAIIVKDDNIIAYGYNGTIRGFDNVCEEGNVTLPTVLHAESNAITKCAKSNYSSNGAILYTTLSPCLECAKLIIQSGITDVYYICSYRNDDGINLLKKAGINVWQKIY